ncbi:thioesterase II family protein [Janthinobacterium agaricidamnosum]|uniref:thioesterase II family protein n=1 Tax=Janthinobacterium agaricidamnosum TaxID=55508 RepID=UPI0007749D42|nr:alpha/beta fold hydrolase [Janthinobacterium agaricidamnosum]
MKQQNRWLEPLIEDQRPLLFCLPYAGGGGSVFRQWPEALGDLVQVCPLLLPGRDGRIGEEAIGAMAQLVDQLAEAIRPLCRRRWSICGHSMGAAIAWELAARFAAEPDVTPPEWLLVSGRGAPGLARQQAPLHGLDQRQFRAALGRLGGTPPEVLAEDELMELLLPMLRADFRLIETWQPSLAVLEHTRILALGADDDIESVSARLQGWQARTRAEARVVELRGDHFSIIQRPAALLEQMRSALEWPGKIAA